jgi:SAM-dependent methyltransferase
VSGTLAAAYTAAGDAWQAGPGRIYDRLARELVDRCPGGVAGRRVLDLGAGTGAASRAATASGVREVVAVDVATGMLARDRASRPPAVAGDALALPLRDRSFGAVVAAFSLNHLTDPGAGLAEAARVLDLGGGLAVSAYAADDAHPVKEAVESACSARGWEPPDWHRVVRSEAMPLLATVKGATDAAACVLDGAEVSALRVAFPDLSPRQLVGWRLGMAQVADFVAALPSPARASLEADAMARLGPDPPVLVRSCITITWRRPP